MHTSTELFPRHTLGESTDSRETQALSWQKLPDIHVAPVLARERSDHARARVAAGAGDHRRTATR
jgi:hypothetical protein